MITQVIFASKVYKTSRRKQAIQSALMLPNNEGLVQQLADALDEEYRPLAQDPNDPTTQKADEAKDPLDPGLDDDFDVESNLVHVSDNPGGSGPLGPKPSADDIDVDGPDGDGPDMEDKPDGDEPDVEEGVDDSAPEEPVEESTKINACCDLDVSLIKGTLNANADTAGVARIVTKEKELWIYYNDDINMNDVMIDVVDYLNASGQTNLEFNRLARSDNAMVFIINEQKQEIKPNEAEEES
jgi:hypothetical protein